MPAMARCWIYPTQPDTLRSKHPKKEVEHALRAAEAAGFEVVTGRGHWGLIRCPGTPPDHCKTMSINGTPRNPGTHARQIARFVARCPHKASDV
jgi:hypothetical protein